MILRRDDNADIAGDKRRADEAREEIQQMPVGRVELDRVPARPDRRPVSRWHERRSGVVPPCHRFHRRIIRTAEYKQSWTINAKSD
jgi:hypothetical protein